MSNTYTDSVTNKTAKPSASGTVVQKPSTSGTIIQKPSVAGSLINEPYVGLYALLTEHGFELLHEDNHAMNTEN